MRRFPWDIVLALLAGVGLGLVYAWMISPLNVTNADPSILRADFKDQYRSTIAAAYVSTGNLPRAQARLALLKEANPVDALNAQAQRILARGDPAQVADQMAALALALQEGPGEPVSASKPATEVPAAVEQTPTMTPLLPSADLTFVLTETLLSSNPADTQPALPVSTPRTTQTAIPTQSAPYKLTAQDELCDPNLPEGILQVIVLGSNRRQMPGMEIDITWEGNVERFFTGLKRELGNGYADFIMMPEVPYTVQLGAGSDIAAGLTTPTCQTPTGETFFGGIKLTFQQP